MQKEEQQKKTFQPADEEEDIRDMQEGYADEEDLPDEAIGENSEEAADADDRSEKRDAELKEQKDKYLRLVAEFDNYRKRISRERIELMQTAEREVIIALLDVLDDCDRATEQMKNTDDINIVKEGALLIFNKLRTQLQARGLKEMKSIREDFDAELHDAVTEIPAPSDDLKGKVIDNIQKGYYLNDKLIRHAKVVVGK